MKAGEYNKSLLRRFTVTNFYALYLFLPSVQFLRIESFFLKELESFLELQVIGCITNKSLKLSGFSLPGLRCLIVETEGLFVDGDADILALTWLEINLLESLQLLLRSVY